MKPLITTFSFLSLATLGFGQTTVTLNGASGSQSYSIPRSTNGDLSINLALEIEYLIVGGGGGGGGSASDGTAWGAGGGGAGGVLQGSALMFAPQYYGVTVGSGGVGGARTSGASLTQMGSNGGFSSFLGVNALGGGGGGLYKVIGEDGGSGGGGGGRGTGNNLRTAGGDGTDGQGYAGGASRDDDSTGRSAGGGGGGAGGLGGSGGVNVTVAGNGGVGLVSSISGSAVTYAGGGGGGAWDTFEGETAGTGGLGGGGAGSTSGNASSGINGLGGGGGGAGTNGAGGNGGSGSVIVRYEGGQKAFGGIAENMPATDTTPRYTVHTFSTPGSSNYFDLLTLGYQSALGAVENGVISGSGNLKFTGPGRLTLNAANTFTGFTQVNAGTLAIGSGGSIANSAGVHISPGAIFNVSTVDGGYTLLSDQTLSGGGQVIGDIIIEGTHAPGFSPGLQEIQGNLTYSEGASVVWELIDNTLAGRGTNYDGIDVQGSQDYLGTEFDGHLTFDGATTLKLDFALLESAVDWSHSLWGSDITGTNGWKIFNATGDITGLENLQIENSSWLDANGVALSAARTGASFSLFQQGEGIYLNYSAVPEPSAALLGGLGMLALLRRRRR